MELKNINETEDDKVAISLAKDLWNKCLELEYTNEDDINDIRFHIHAIQNLLYSNIYLKGLI